MAGKGENAGYQHFLPFPQCFQKLLFQGCLKSALCSKELINTPIHVCSTSLVKTLWTKKIFSSKLKLLSANFFYFLCLCSERFEAYFVHLSLSLSVHLSVCSKLNSFPLHQKYPKNSPLSGMVYHKHILFGRVFERLLPPSHLNTGLFGKRLNRFVFLW